MANEAINAYLVGYSSRASNPDFREEVRKQVKGGIIAGIRFDLIILAVTVLLALLYIPLNYTTMDETMPILYVILFFLWVLFVPVGLFFIIMVLFTVNFYFTDYLPLKKESVDCTVSKTKQWVSTTTDERGYTSKHNNYRIVLQPETGLGIRLREHKAKAYMPYVEEGDKVRYHPGFPYPIELYDKSNINICIFCGEANEPANSSCKKCGKLMLI